MICFCKYTFEEEPWNGISDEAKDFISSLLVFDSSKRMTASEALEHKWIKKERHKKLNLQRSISSNWSNSCVSLKNEKGLKRRVKLRDSTNPSKISPNSAKKTTYGAIHRSHDDKLYRKESHEKTRPSEGNKDSLRQVWTTVVDAPNSNTNPGKSEEMDENEALKSLQEKQANEKVKKWLKMDANDASSQKEGRKINVNRKPSKTVSKVSPLIVDPAKNSRCAAKYTPSTLESVAQPNAEDCNGNLAFVKRIPSSMQRTKPCVDDTTSSRLNDSCKDEFHEHSPLNIPKTNNRATLLPPIKASVAPALVTVSKTATWNA